MKKQKYKIKFGLPDRFEIGLFVLAFILFGVFDYAQNHFQDVNDISVMSLFAIPAITLFWISVVAYHIVLFTGIFRAYNSKSTHYVFDFIMGTIAILGIYFIIGGAIGGIYYDTNQPIPWFFGLTQITMYHTLGVLLQVLAFLWFVFTE